MVKAVRGCGHFDEVRAFIGDMYGPDLHAKRIDSLAGATLGAMTAASLAVAMIGHALAQARGLVTKHAVKQSLPPAFALGYAHMSCRLRIKPKKPLARRGGSTIRLVSATGEQEP